MQPLIAKYINAYQTESGNATEKVKKILMYYSHSWDWTHSEGLVSDLIDDANITAGDIVDFLADSYEIEGGNEDFHYAVRALQICLRKAKLSEAALQIPKIDEDFNDDSFGVESDFYMSRSVEVLQTMQY